jgi:alpha-ketoglutarate-dependent taurine dioxygenase
MAELIAPTADRPYVTVVAEHEASPLDMAVDMIVALYKQHGALLLRGFAIDVDHFRRFAEQFCATSTFNESGGRAILDRTHNIQSVNRGVAPFPLHPELSREPWKPDVCFFGCLSPPGEQGATTICDGVEIVRHLPAEIRSAFDGRRLLYLQPAMSEELAYWLGTPTPDDRQLASPPPRSPYFFGRSGSTIVRGFTRPALHRPMFTQAPAFGNFLLFARYLRGMTDFPLFEDGSVVPDALLRPVKAVSDGLTAAIAWQRGDLLMIDNTRFMHGRTAVVDPGERLIASYFGYLRFALPDPEEPLDPPWRRGSFNPLRLATAITPAD